MLPVPDPAGPLTYPSDPPATGIAWNCPPFPRPLEQEFLGQGARVWMRTARNWLVLTVGLGWFMIWGAALSGMQAVAASALLLGMASLLLALAIPLLRRLSPGRPREGLFGAVLLLLVAIIAAQGWWMSETYANRYVMAAGLTLFSVFLIVPLRLRACAALCPLGLAVLTAVTLLAPNPAQRECWDLIIFTALALPLGLRVRATAEADQRSLFLLRRREARHRQALLRANERLRELSETDPLTGVANRRSFDAALRRALDPGSAPPLLLLLDVDHFKRFNDACGHPKGDECLRLVARAVRDQLRREDDLVARIGGEEFAVLLLSGQEEDGLEVAERIRLAVEVLLLPHPDRPDLPPVITVSVGLAAAIPQDTAETLLARADAALYAAKAAGRNQVYVAGLEAAAASLLPEQPRLRA